MKLFSRNGKQFLSIKKSEWLKIGEDFKKEDLDWFLDPEEEKKKEPKNVSGDYTTRGPLKSMPEEKSPPDVDPVVAKKRHVKVEQGKAFEFIPSKGGEFIKRKIDVIDATSPEDIQKIQSYPLGYQEAVRNDIVRQKIRNVINSVGKQFVFIGFWEKTKASTWRHMLCKVLSKAPDENLWTKLKVFDVSIKQVRDILIDNIDYIRGSGTSYVVDRVAENAHINEQHPEGKANFVSSALSAAKKAAEEAKNVIGE